MGVCQEGASGHANAAESEGESSTGVPSANATAGRAAGGHASGGIEEVEFGGTYGAPREEPSDQAIPEWFDFDFVEIKPISGFSITFSGAELSLEEREELAILIREGLRKIRSRINSA